MQKTAGVSEALVISRETWKFVRLFVPACFALVDMGPSINGFMKSKYRGKKVCSNANRKEVEKRGNSIRNEVDPGPMEREG